MKVFLPDGNWVPANGGLVHAQGFKVSSGCAKLRSSSSSRPDCALLVSMNGNVPAAGVFTQCKVSAAPVQVSFEALKQSGNRASAVLLNAAQANAATGTDGINDAYKCMQAVASNFHKSSISEKDVLLQSTGVIGERLATDQLVQYIPSLAHTLSDDPDSSTSAADAIRTTDTVTKEAALTASIDGLGEVKLGGIAKGSGMIHPNMGTMLSMLTCDAAVAPQQLQQILHRAVDLTFNQVTVDGCTSTNDTVMALAGGEANAESLSEKAGMQLQDAFTAVCTALAKAIAWDGEGAGTLIEVRAYNARTESEARAAARAVASSHLVKAAVHGCDANWGRVVAAAGNAGVSMDEHSMSAFMAGVPLFEKGKVTASAEREAQVHDAIRHALHQHSTLTIDVDLAVGAYKGTAWTCDLSAEYVAINAEYRS